MKFANRDPFDEVAALGMPFPEDVILTDGITEVIWGMREENPEGDIDWATVLENNLYLEEEKGFRTERMEVGISKDGIKRTIVARRDENNRYDSHRWHFSMTRWNRTSKGRLYIAELGAMSVADPKTNIRVLLPQYIPLIKLDTARGGKDIEAVDRAREFLSKHGIPEAEETVNIPNSSATA
jgi:hypothetical protein